MFAYYSKEDIKKIVKEAPSGTKPSDLINKLLAKGHVLEGFLNVGPKGEQGEKGERGTMGPPGMPGEAGETGPQGESIAGPQGPMGPMGPEGARGSQGLMGKTGRDGRDGRDGKDGRDGIDGSPDTGEEIIAKINNSEEQIDAARIKNLPRQTVVNHGMSPMNVGGFETPIIAGANIVVTKDAFGRWVITSTASGSGGGGARPTSGTVNGVNAVFVFSTAPTIISVDNGKIMMATNSDGTVNWTGTTTITLAVAPTFDIFQVS